MAAELGSRQAIAHAAHLVRKAIDLLDGTGAPSDIAAHLDLAVTRLDGLAAECETQRNRDAVAGADMKRKPADY